MTKVRSRLNRNSKLKYTYKTKPFAHQKKALTKLVKLRGVAGLLMEMGTGKTKVAIDWAGIGFYNFETRKVLVVAPLSVLGVWSRQVRQHSGAPFRIIRLTGSTEYRIRLLKQVMRHPDPDRLTYLVINYESLWRETDRGRSIDELLIEWHPDLIIFDESHRIKSPTSRQSKAAFRIAQVVEQRLLLTGTAITKSPLDVFGQFRALNYKIFGTSWKDFRFRYGVWGGFHKYQLKGYRHLQELITKVRKHSYRIRKEQCLDLPPKLFETVPVQLSDRGMAIYHKMAKEMIVEIEEGHATAAIILVKLLRLSQITAGFIKDDEGVIRVFDESKLNTCMDLLDDLLEEDHKVVIFTRFIMDINRMKEKLDKRKVSHLILSGSVPDRKRDSLIEKFQTDEKVKVFIAQLQTGSEGIELFAADSVIYYSLSHNALHYWQSQDRVHRPGQTKKVTYYHLTVPRTYDQVLLTDLKQKKNVADTIIHKPRRLLGLN